MFEAFLTDPWADHPVVNRRVCNFGSSPGPTETKTQETKLPDWVDSASRSNYQQAQSVAANLKGPYEGSRVADLTQGQQSNIDAAQANVGSTNNGFQTAQDATRNFLNYQAPTVQAGQLANTDLSAYMNPFTKDVTNYGLQQLELQRRQALNQTGAQARGAGAFGGSRQGVQEGITNASAAMGAGKLASDLQSQNFLNAQAMATGDIGRRYAADVANQQANLSGAQLGLSASGQLANQTAAGQQSFLSGLDSAMGYGTVQQQQQQAQLDAARGLYNEQKQQPLDQLQILQGSLSNSPYGNTVVGTAPGASSNTGMQAAGLGVGLLGAAATFM